jgi:hypothetical protein
VYAVWCPSTHFALGTVKIHKAELGYTVIEGMEQVSLQARCMTKVKEKYFKTKYRPEDILLNVNAMIYINFKLQLTFINDKNYCYNCKFLNRITLKKYINLKLMFRNNTSYHEKITHWDSHFSMDQTTSAAPCHFVEAFKIALFSICYVQTH